MQTNPYPDSNFYSNIHDETTCLISTPQYENYPHTCKQIFHIFLYSITALAIMILGYLWGRTCFAQTIVNLLEECDILENDFVFEFSNVNQYK